MSNFEHRIKEDSTEFEKAFLKIYDGSLWTALEKMKDWQPPKTLVELPRIIADWIELIKQRNRNVLTLLDSDDMPDDVYDWLFIKEDDENINLILLAWIDGYTVEKEQLYVLEFPLEDPKKFTETEIKAIDERLMAFAVKVDEVEP